MVKMETIIIPVYRCGKCRHRWISWQIALEILKGNTLAFSKRPATCANPRCRSRRWDKR